MKIVILGGSALVRVLADELDSSLLVATSVQVASSLIKRYGEDRVMVGDLKDEGLLSRAGVTSADFVIVATDNDVDNLLIASVVRSISRSHVIVIAEGMENARVLNDMGFEEVISPAGAAAQHILAVIRPESHHVTELYVTEGSPFNGKKVSELALPKGVMVAGILRQDRLVDPARSDLMSKGDHLIIYSTTGRAPIDVLVNKSRQVISPFSEIVLFVEDSEESLTMVREMACLAKDIGSKLKLVARSHQALIQAEDTASAWRIPYSALALEKSPFLDPIGTINGLGVEGTCLAMPMTARLTKGFSARRRTKELISSVPTPLIITRGTYPYRRLLALVEASWKDGKVGEIAVRMAIAGNAELSLLRDSESVEAAEQTRHIRRLARSYGVTVHDIAIEGNPTVELVSKIKSGAYDLVALDWGCKLLKKDIFQRILFESPISVMVKGQPTCELPFRP